MCLLITAFAAIISTTIWYFGNKARKYNLGMLTLMYWGAALMWTVDGIFCVAEGEGFFDMSLNDAMLGILIVLCGLLVWILSILVKDPNDVIKKVVAAKKN